MTERLPPAANLIRRESAFQQGSLARGFNGDPCGTALGAKPVRFDCLGAILWAYRALQPEDRHPIAKRVFDTCRARHGHTMLGKLIWEQACSLLKDVGV